ncbi:MAG: right-handed parallel beta-helix repeat-containing protein [Phycisphaerales bacterium]|nr:right-handed parallel beta-helix repeat-containing protein [Phycisphaerales bacterium]
MTHIAAVIAGLSLAFFGSSATIAGTINVPGDYALIQDAINASSDGDVINIAPGIYTESNLDPGGKPITIQGVLNDGGSLATTIDAQQGGSVFVLNSQEGEGTIIRNLVITGGTGTQTYGFLHGGGIHCQFSHPTISNCMILGHTAERGGGISCLFSSPTIDNCIISDNAADVGGGIYGYGNTSSPSITGCTISYNTAFSGAGISCSSNNSVPNNPILNGCTIKSNTASQNGGGILCTDSNSTIKSCTISGNTANDGGGIYCYSSNPTINECLIEGNSSNSNGGGLACYYNSTPTMINCTLENNSSINIWIDVLTYSDLVLLSSDPPSLSASCCVSSGCVALTSDDCTALGGNWLGEGSSCDDCPASCSGDTNNDGVINIEDLLNMLSNFGSVCP